jgi:DNA-directed RNA polymerase specialized sigma24 family protein
LPLPSDNLRQEILALQPALRAFADRLTQDDGEADTLVGLTVAEAMKDQPERAGDETRDTRLWLFAILRGSFHSVARRREQQRRRGAPTTVWNADRAAAFAAPREPAG